MKKKIYVKPETKIIRMTTPHMLTGSGEYIYRGTPADKDDGDEDPDKEEWPKGGGDYWLAE